MDNDKLFAFVLMPFGQQFSDIYRFGIKEPAAELNFLAERVDEQIYAEGMLERIYRQIELADVVIADMSGQNSNVFYEVGYAHAKEKLCVLLTSCAEDIPFDLKHRRHVVYGNSIKMLKERLVEELIWARGEIENVRKSHIKVQLKGASGDLEKTKFWAEGNIEFKIDLLNESSKPSAEIEAAYFYSTKGWRLFQEGRECPSTDSDVIGFNKRHFLTPPLRRLPRDSWGQLKFKATKILAWATKGEELRDYYKASGRSVLRLVTSEGNLDYDIPIDVSVDDIPF